MLRYTFRLSETFFQISTPKAEKKLRVKCDIKPQPWAVLTSWYRAHAMHRARSARSAWGSQFLGSICLWQAWLLPEISQEVWPLKLPHCYRVHFSILQSFFFFSLTQKTSGFSFVLNARMGWSDVVRVIDSLKQRVLGDVWDMPVVPRNTTVWISTWFW